MNIEKILEAIEITTNIPNSKISDTACDLFFTSKNKRRKRSGYKKRVSYWIAFYLDPNYPKNDIQYQTYVVNRALERIFGCYDLQLLTLDKEAMIKELLKLVMDNSPISEWIKHREYIERFSNYEHRNSYKDQEDSGG